MGGMSPQQDRRVRVLCEGCNQPRKHPASEQTASHISGCTWNGVAVMMRLLTSLEGVIDQSVIANQKTFFFSRPV